MKRIECEGVGDNDGFFEVTPEGSNSDLNALLSADEFNRLYVGEFKPDPIINECVAFLRWATPKQISEYKRDGLFTVEQIRESRRILRLEQGR